MVVPVEVPIHLRPSFILVVGVWYDKPKPNMNSFLKPLSEKLRALHTKGVKWEHPSTSELHESRVTVPLCVADAPARAKAQNILGHNGKYGCNTCEIKAMRSAWVPGKRRTLYYPYSHSPVLRTEARMTLQAMRALREGKTFKGVKGPSVLSIIPSLDISCSFVPEYMHSVLLGVVKQIVSLWCSSQEPWMVMNRIPFIDNILSSVKHPDFVHRTGRTLKMLKYWKASDFYYFLLFESVLILKDYLPDVYLQHYFLLVEGIFLLLKKSVSELEISIAESLLKLFVSKFLDLYGDRAMSYNVHQLCHLALCVRKYGPLYANNAFMFEDVNGLVASATHGTNEQCCC
ncbi:hypothetical protein ONE63_003491 [Megalurothrips usitatus]|uniref:Uncharacterized protein n=1 Tax=Megalurothrips usitatus TaxID=439358 RepID=A0AAV7X9P1_9NEOP|nr:hypothetical protein ONE63_003491 [Megalurothrips usitatus]